VDIFARLDRVALAGLAVVSLTAWHLMGLV
jgi:hypothetical protein